MSNNVITRRFAIKKLFTWTKMALMLGFFPCPPLITTACARKKQNLIGTQSHDLSLREAALRKTHHGNDCFINPFSKTNFGNPWRMVQWKLFSENHFKVFYNQERVNPVSIDWKPILHNNGLSITFLKHAGVIIKDQDEYILVDPIFFDLSWLFKDFSPLAFDIREMPQPDYVLITHGHYDHLDIPTLASLNRETQVITPLGYNEVFDDLKMNRHTQMDWFDTFNQGDRQITLLPCNHWTMRNPLVGPNKSLWGSFLIKTASGPTIFISGDTAYFDGFSDIGQEFPIDLAIFNLSAYEPRWLMATSHMNPKETVRAFRELRAKSLLIVHWGTFRLGDEPVHFPPIYLREELQKEGLSHCLVHVDHGQTVFLTKGGRVL